MGAGSLRAAVARRAEFLRSDSVRIKIALDTARVRARGAVSHCMTERLYVLSPRRVCRPDGQPWCICTGAWRAGPRLPLGLPAPSSRLVLYVHAYDKRTHHHPTLHIFTSLHRTRAWTTFMPSRSSTLTSRRQTWCALDYVLASTHRAYVHHAERSRAAARFGEPPRLVRACAAPAGRPTPDAPAAIAYPSLWPQLVGFRERSPCCKVPGPRTLPRRPRLAPGRRADQGLRRDASASHTNSL